MKPPEAGERPRDPVTAGLLHCVALRRQYSYAVALAAAAYAGAEFREDHSVPRLEDIGKRYAALAEEWLVAEYKTARAAAAALDLAVSIVGEREIANIFERGGPVLDEIDTVYALWALTGVAHYVSRHAMREYLDAAKS